MLDLMNGIVNAPGDLLSFVKNEHRNALLLFTLLIPVLSIDAVFGIRRTSNKRLQTLLSTFPQLENSEFYLLFKNSISRLKPWKYIIPILFLSCTNLFMSFILLDSGKEIAEGRVVYLLCGGHCFDSQVKDLPTYQTQAIVIGSYAFLGWTVWTLTSIFDRAATQQLFPATFSRLLVRLAAAILVAVVVYHLMSDSSGPSEARLTAGPVFAFLVGMFPERGLKIITDKFNQFARASDHSEDFDLELIEGIDPTMTFRMKELGIGSAADLSAANPFSIYEAAALPMSQMVDWIAQSQLLILVKAGRFATLQMAGYRTIFDVVRLLRSPNGATTVQSLCNWMIPTGYDQVAAIEATGDYKRLLAIYVAIGSSAPTQ